MIDLIEVFFKNSVLKLLSNLFSPASICRYIKEGITADDLEEIYKKAHAGIRSDPAHVKKEVRTNVEVKRWNWGKKSLSSYKKGIEKRKKAVLADIADQA